MSINKEKNNINFKDVHLYLDIINILYFHKIILIRDLSNNIMVVNKCPRLDTSDIEYRNIILRLRILLAGGLGTRQAVVASATYLSEEEKIPYFWGGKYSKVGLNKEWNSLKPILSVGSDIQFKGDKWFYGLDCSGFVSWTIINGGYKMEVSYTGAYLDYIKPTVYRYNIQNLKSTKVKAGDLLYRKGHIAIITYLDQEKKLIKVAEEKGAKYGMIVSRMSIEDFVKNNNYTHIYNMDNYYNDKNNMVINNKETL